jgi:hypothetical protein
MKQRLLNLCVQISFGISLSLQFEKKKNRRCWLSSGGCLQHDNSRYTVQRIQDLKVVVLHLPWYAPDWAPNDFHLFCPISRSRWASLQIVWGGAWLAGTATKSVPRNLCLSVTLAEVCGTCWGTALKINVIVLCLFVQNNTLYIFSRLHLNGSCTSRLPTCRSMQGIYCNLLAFQSWWMPEAVTFHLNSFMNHTSYFLYIVSHSYNNIQRVFLYVLQLTAIRYTPTYHVRRPNRDLCGYGTCKRKNLIRRYIQIERER